MLAKAVQNLRQDKPGPRNSEEWFYSGEEGDRILVLAATKEHPDLLDLVRGAIDDPHSVFDQDRFLVLAAEMLPTSKAGERDRLREVLAHQRGPAGHIRPHRIRWLSSKRLLPLMDR